jgi:hypothetical protein
MIPVIFMLERSPQMFHAAFQRYGREIHGPPRCCGLRKSAFIDRR